ncbi:hypothetical protein AAVH_24226 [Aphelenchoides avenae]|nr:hypothetical protein AAVH_24226 [Aphelenchus avenae]
MDSFFCACSQIFLVQAVILSLFLQSIAAEILQDKANQNTVYKFDDSVQAKVIERLEASKATSIVSDDLSIKEHLSTGSENGDGYDSLSSLFRIISYQMPFNDDSFDDITDADL